MSNYIIRSLYKKKFITSIENPVAYLIIGTFMKSKCQWVLNY